MNDLTIEELKKIRDDALDAVAATDAAYAAASAAAAAADAAYITRNAAWDAFTAADAAYDAALNKKGGGNMNDLTIEELKKPMLEQVQTLKASLLNLSREELIAMVEALTPEPTVVSEWLAVYPGWSRWYGTRNNALDTQITRGDFIALVRKDVITHPNGKVEYKLEVEVEG